MRRRTKQYHYNDNKPIHKNRRRNSRRNPIGLIVGLILLSAVIAIPITFLLNSNMTSGLPVFADASNPATPVWIDYGDATTIASNADVAYGEEVIMAGLSPITSGPPRLPSPPEPEAPIAPASPFSGFAFYKPQHTEDYAYFQYRHPNYDPETVVWKVNAFLHVPFYSYIRTNYDPNPLLVNPANRLPYGFSPSVLVPACDSAPHLLATPETAEAFRLMRQAAQQDGINLVVASAYRPATRQAYLFRRQGYRDGVVARPYQSEHQTGRALDLAGPGGGLLDGGGGPLSPTGQWVRDNAHYFGFIVRYTEENSHITSFINEPWHITYVTTGIARHMVFNNISSLEEFVARYPWWGMN